VHLPERECHLLEDVLLFNAGGNQVRVQFLGKFLEFVSADIVVDNGVAFGIVGGALVVVTMTELLACTNYLHA
jgi:hypothetical protein